MGRFVHLAALRIPSCSYAADASNFSSQNGHDNERTDDPQAHLQGSDQFECHILHTSAQHGQLTDPTRGENFPQTLLVSAIVGILATISPRQITRAKTPSAPAGVSIWASDSPIHDVSWAKQYKATANV
ncbi:hypothetical protein ASPCADRAFT_209055 [Aspergillus carbonarius ITEM 5010]|uniref:Uncharacterized protein n=1 Tax=Aspergillus carbonarius (strain ITEM 5010) TaxID=602072 RepID=A0A1R3RH57_ASPC5|nr:hypothetical protein ASPCADRAFT_209055 [Aspergillus carbonarius ITEM 5010]